MQSHKLPILRLDMQTAPTRCTRQRNRSVGCLFSSNNNPISEKEEILKDERYTEVETNDSAFSLILSWHGTLKWSDICFVSETVIAIPLIISGACHRSVPSDKIKGQNQLKKV
jgi:hypothetical protein